MQEIHIWHYCSHCKIRPLLGTRYHCNTCAEGPDNDLCSSCWEKYRKGEIKHPEKNNFSKPASNHSFSKHNNSSVKNCESWLQIDGISYPPPKIRHGFLVRPEFQFGDCISFGTYGFVIKINARNIMLTALHVLDEVIKDFKINTCATNSNYTGLELPYEFTKIELYDVLEEKWMFHHLGSGNEMLTLPDARTNEQEPKSNRDICAFLVESRPEITPGKLAEKAPIVGEPVWLAARLTDSTFLNQAVIVEKTQDSLVFRYLDSQLRPQHVSGSALLNNSGDVVGIVCGIGCYQSHELGHANHVDNIHKHLKDYCSI